MPEEQEVRIEARRDGYRRGRPMTTRLDLAADDLAQRLDAILEGFASTQDRERLVEWHLEVTPTRSPDFVHHHTGGK